MAFKQLLLLGWWLLYSQIHLQVGQQFVPIVEM